MLVSEIPHDLKDHISIDMVDFVFEHSSKFNIKMNIHLSSNSSIRGKPLYMSSWPNVVAIDEDIDWK